VAYGFIIKSLMVCARLMNVEAALQLAELLVKKVFADPKIFSPDNTFCQGGHAHTNLRTLVGAADYALCANDPVIYSRVDALYRYAKSITTRFGFLPEVIGRQGDMIACETCTLMDYIGLAVTLANHGHPEYWGEVERAVRNHLIESQVLDTSWLKSNPNKPDTKEFSWRDIDKRMLGGYAGWSAPNHILAYCETLIWGGPELRGKIRAFQNCCGGSGTHAFFIAWKNSARYDNGCLTVNLHIDKLLPQAEIRSYQPYQGLLTIQLKRHVMSRFAFRNLSNRRNLKLSEYGRIKTWGNFLDLGHRQAGETIRISYPLPVYQEEISIGNPGFRQYHYRVTWKGDTVVKMEPLGNDYETGYSDFDKRECRLFL
jgi:hypothetical protein